jgi:hypothetical protein
MKFSDIAKAKEKAEKNGSEFNEIKVDFLEAVDMIIDYEQIDGKISVSRAKDIVHSVATGTGVIYGAKIVPIFPKEK